MDRSTDLLQPARTGWTWWTVVGVSVAICLAVTGLLYFHPAGGGARLLGSGSHYYWLHIVLLFGFPLTALVLVALLRGVHSVEAWVARVAAFVYACAYGAYDALAGITIAAYTMRAERAPDLEQVETILAMRQPLSATGVVRQFAVTGRWSWIVATVATAAALHRLGVRLWVTLPLLASGYLLLEHDHTPRYGYTAFAALTVGALLAELVPRRRRR